MTERAKYWRGLLREWKGSGLSQAEFCRQRGVKAMTFYWWKRQLTNGPSGVGSRGGRKVPKAKARSGKGTTFVEIKSAGLKAKPPRAMTEAASVCAYEVVLSRGRVVCVPGDFDPDTLSRLITAVESC